MSAFPSVRRSTSITILLLSSTVLLVSATPQLKADVLQTIESQLTALGATEFEIAFVTEGTTTAQSTEIGTYNTFVTKQANAAPDGSLVAEVNSQFSPTWNAIVSTALTSASVNAPSSSAIPIFDTNGDQISPFYAGHGLYTIFGSIKNPIGYTQGGVSLSTYVWTGSVSDGSGATYLGIGEEAGQTTVGYGASYASNTSWINYGVISPNTYAFSLYALSTPIAVPEPATLTLLGPAILGLGVVYLRRRAAKR